MFDFLFKTDALMTYFLVMIRISGMLSTAPIFGSSFVKPMVRISLAIAITMILFRFIPPITLASVEGPLLIVLILKELLIGIMFGVILRLMFVAVQIGGEFIGFQMGFSMVNVMDPTSGTSLSLMDQFLNITVTLIFIAVDGHHLVIKSIAQSFSTIPLGVFTFKTEAPYYIVTLLTECFLIGLKIVAPVFVIMMIKQLIMGFIGRLVPQMNLLVSGFPIQIAVGTLVFTMSLSYIYTIFEKIMNIYFKHLLVVFDILGR